MSRKARLTAATVHALQYITRVPDDAICIRSGTVETEKMAFFSIAMGHFWRNTFIVTALALDHISHSS